MRKSWSNFVGSKFSMSTAISELRKAIAEQDEQALGFVEYLRCKEYCLNYERTKDANKVDFLFDNRIPQGACVPFLDYKNSGRLSGADLQKVAVEYMSAPKDKVARPAVPAAPAAAEPAK